MLNTWGDHVVTLLAVYLEVVEILGQVVGPGGLLGQEGVEVGGQLVLGHHHLLAHCLQLILTVIHTYIICYT